MTKFNPFPVLAAILLVAGCGQKGPLYLPGDPSEMQTEIPEIEPGTLPGADDGDDGDDESDDKAKDEANSNQPEE